jgi:hypothetical protein
VKVIIYFGHHKVGSTALQAFLALNWRKLAAAGILYPAVESEGLAHNLAVALGSGGGAALDAMNVREPHNALAFQMLAAANNGKAPAWHGNLPAVPQMIRALRKQETYLDPHTVLLVSEVLSNFGARHPDLIDRLKGIYPDAEFELYCVLRRPDDYLASWHGQRLRFGDKVPALADEAMAIYGHTIHFDYHRMVAPWIDRFGEARVHVRTYSEVLASGGSAQDFLATVGGEFPAGLEPVGEANRGIPRAAMEIVRRANHALPPEAARELMHFFLDLPPAVRPTPNADVEMFGTRQRALLAEAFAPIHDYLSGLTGRPFFPDVAELAELRPVPEAQAAAGLLEQIDPAALPTRDVAAFIDSVRREYPA